MAAQQICRAAEIAYGYPRCTLQDMSLRNASIEKESRHFDEFVAIQVEIRACIMKWLSGRVGILRSKTKM